MTDGETTWTYTYNADGLRTKRTDGTDTYTYAYYGGVLRYMEKNGTPYYFTTAPDGTPMGIVEDETAYYYVTNLQGDVIGIVEKTTGQMVVTYTYDAWGNVLSITGSRASTIGTANPIRYRGYVYDQETGFYYLQSRYYNPETGRFLNADDTAYLGASGTLVSYNLFAYCGNNPVTGYDPTGYFSWIDVFNTAAVVTIAAVAVIAIVGSGGAAAPPLLAAASTLIGTTVTAAAATTVATGVAAIGVATMGVAATASILESSSKQGKDYVKARSNKQANQWAKEVGYDGAEELKADWVGKKHVSKYNMYTDRSTREIILIAIRTAKEIATKLFRP